MFIHKHEIEQIWHTIDSLFVGKGLKKVLKNQLIRQNNYVSHLDPHKLVHRKIITKHAHR